MKSYRIATKAPLPSQIRSSNHYQKVYFLIMVVVGWLSPCRKHMDGSGKDRSGKYFVICFALHELSGQDMVILVVIESAIKK